MKHDTPARAAVKSRLKEMGRVLQAVPSDELRWLNSMRAVWPDVESQRLGLIDLAQAPVVNTPSVIMPTSEQVTRAEQCLVWLLPLSGEQRKIVSAWSMRVPMPRVARQFHFSTRRAWYVLEMAIDGIVACRGPEALSWRATRY